MAKLVLTNFIPDQGSPVCFYERGGTSDFVLFPSCGFEAVRNLGIICSRCFIGNMSSDLLCISGRAGSVHLQCISEFRQ